MKEKDKLNVTLRTLCRDVNRLLEIAGARSRATQHPEHAHVIEGEYEEEVSIKEEQKAVPRTQRVRSNPQYNTGQNYFT